MPIIKCPGCGGQLSTSAPACPRCQHVPTEEELSLANSRVGPEESRVSPVVADTVLSDNAVKEIRAGKSTGAEVGGFMAVAVAFIFIFFLVIFFAGNFPFLTLGLMLIAGVIGGLIWWLKG